MKISDIKGNCSCKRLGFTITYWAFHGCSLSLFSCNKQENFWRGNGKKTTLNVSKLSKFWCCWSSDYGYLFIKVLDLTGYFLYSARLRVDKKPLRINQRELIKEIDFNIFTCKKEELVIMTAVNVKYSVSVLIMIQYFSCFVIYSVFSPWVELITNNLNISTTEKNQNRSTFKKCKI